MSLENLVNAAKKAIGKRDLIRQASNMVMTLLTAEHVSKEEVQRRLEICSVCPHSEVNSQGEPYCGKCGCSVVQNEDKLLNKLRYKTMADGSPVCPERNF